jgi:thiosulfate reductase cytochrome b subunit
MAQDLLAGALASQQAAMPCADPAAIQALSALPGAVGLPHGGHARWVRLSHWIVAMSVLTLAVTGFVILMAHPRLYWGVAGNDLTPALFELPISRNYRHGGWDKSVAFFPQTVMQTGSPVSASRTYDIFNDNSWGRSLHFLAGWFLALTGAAYLVAGIYTGHFRRHLLPGADERTGRRVWQDLVSHLQFRLGPTTGGPPYGILQKWSYAGVVFLALPVMIVTGLAMSPAITVAYPFLSNMFGGSQSARTIHFFVFAALIVFLLVHVLMVVLSGFRRQMRAMTLGT